MLTPAQAFVTPFCKNLFLEQSCYLRLCGNADRDARKRLSRTCGWTHGDTYAGRRLTFDARGARTEFVRLRGVQRYKSGLRDDAKGGVCKTWTRPTMAVESGGVADKTGSRKDTPGKDEASTQHGLVLRRDEVGSLTRNGRTGKTKRWTTLDELGIRADELCFRDAGAEDAANWEGGSGVYVQLAVQPVGKDFRVLGKMSADIRRTCDRCMRLFTERSEGRFEVVLDVSGCSSVMDNAAYEEATKRAQSVNSVLQDAEAVESFPASVDEVDLSCHARDAILLGVPTRALCSRDCAGIPVTGDDDVGSVRYGGANRDTE